MIFNKFYNTVSIRKNTFHKIEAKKKKEYVNSQNSVKILKNIM